MVTMGYGFTAEDIDWSCPAELEPYAKAHKMYLEEQDSIAWKSGIYMHSAIIVALDEAFNGRNAKAKYIEEPILSQVGNSHEMTQEEKDRQVDLFFKQQNAMRINWKRSHRNGD